MMNSLKQSIDKLQGLLDHGIITSAEFDTKRQALVNNYVGLDAAGAAAAPAKAAGAGKPKPKPKPKPAAIPALHAAYPEEAAQAMYLGAPAPYVPHPYAKWPAAAAGGKGKWKGPRSAPAAAAALQPRGGFSSMAPRHHPYAAARPPKAKRGGQPRAPAPDDASSVVAVKVQPMPQGVTNQELAEVFSVFGEVESAVVKAGTPSFGYVNFAAPEYAQAAAAAEQIELKGQWCAVALGKKTNVPTPEPGPTNGIGLFNLPLGVTEEVLQEVLEQYEGFQVVKKVHGKSGRLSCYALAYFDTVENAANARELLYGLVMGEQQVDVKFSTKSLEDLGFVMVADA